MQLLGQKGRRCPVRWCAADRTETEIAQQIVLSKREPADPHPLPPNMSARALLDAATPSPTMAPLPFGLSVNDADSMWLLIGAILVFFMRKLP